MRKTFTTLLIFLISIHITSCKNNPVDSGESTTPDVHTVTFIPNGGSDVPAQQIMDGLKSVEPKTPLNDGYIFIAWHNTPELNSVWNFLTMTINSNIQLYAEWKPIDYSISYILNGGENHLDNPIGFTIESSEINLLQPSNKQNEFGGWYSDSLFTIPIEVIEKGTSGDIKLFAKWIATSGVVTFDSKEGSNTPPRQVPIGATIIEPREPTLAGHTFIGWFSDSLLTTLWDFTKDRVASDMTLYAGWELTTFTISYNLNNGTNHTDNPMEYNISTPDIVFQDPIRAQYTFEGWYTTSWFTTRVSQIDSGATGNRTLYAKWSPINCVITFNTGGGNIINSRTILIGDTIPKPNHPSRKGYLFSGWFADSLFDIEWNFSTDNATGDTTIFAKWTPIVYSITYHLDGGVNAPTNPYSYTADDDTITVAPPTKGGRSFYGWYSDSNYKTPVNTIPSGSTNNINLYAKWVITVTFNTGEGTPIEPKIFNRSSLVNTPEIPTKNGYTFAGWFKDQSFNSHWNFGHDIASSDTTIYVRWINSGTNGVITDGSGNVYKTVIIGNQEWMTENLRTTRYANGEPIPHVPNSGDWYNLNSGAYCVYNSTITTHGLLYNWWVVSPDNENPIAPEGWRVPTQADIEELREHLITNEYNWDGTNLGNKTAKSIASTSGWTRLSSAKEGEVQYNQETNNSTGLGLGPGGVRRRFNYENASSRGFWWTTTISNNQPVIAGLSWASVGFNTAQGSGYRLADGLSIRLVRDIPK